MMKNSQSKKSILVGLKPNDKIMYNFSRMLNPAHSTLTD
jgi:hypothetical protein